MIQDKIPAIQEALGEAELDGWLFACFNDVDPIGLRFLGFNEESLLTRRCYYLVRREGRPRKLVHALEPEVLDTLPGEQAVYLTWKEHRQRIAELVGDCRRLAVQYSPRNELPTVSYLDAGTAELLREAGCELVSSADLVQRFAAVWSEEQLASHRRAADALPRLLDGAFSLVAEAVRAGREIDEHRVQQFLLEGFDREGLRTDAAPIVGVNAHSADPHYQPGPEGSSAIRKGNFLLIDLWAREKASDSIYADITWCAVCDAAPTDEQQEIFSIVARARDAALELVRSRYPGEEVRGFEVDAAARLVIREAGFGDYFIHRTGHSIHTSEHGPGANMDDLETHDTRLLIPMTGFSIEPGIYQPGRFGVRSEINVVLTPDRAEVSGREPQKELVRLLE